MASDETDLSREGENWRRAGHVWLPNTDAMAAHLKPRKIILCRRRDSRRLCPCGARFDQAGWHLRRVKAGDRASTTSQVLEKAAFAPIARVEPGGQECLAISCARRRDWLSHHRNLQIDGVRKTSSPRVLPTPMEQSRSSTTPMEDHRVPARPHAPNGRHGSRRSIQDRGAYKPLDTGRKITVRAMRIHRQQRTCSVLIGWIPKRLSTM